MVSQVTRKNAVAIKSFQELKTEIKHEIDAITQEKIFWANQNFKGYTNLLKKNGCHVSDDIFKTQRSTMAV